MSMVRNLPGEYSAFTDELLKSDRLPVYKISYKKKQCTVQLAGVLTV